MSRTQIVTPDAPAPVGPYSQAILNDGWLHLAGQIGLDASTGRLVDGGLEAEAVTAMKNVTAILAAGNATWADVSSLTVYLVEVDDFARFNSIYQANIPSGTKPARTTIVVKELPLGAKIEMTAIARAPNLAPGQDG